MPIRQRRSTPKELRALARNKLLQDHAKKTRRYENLNRKKRGKSELCERREHKKWLTIM
jgi:hypothetical protein